MDYLTISRNIQETMEKAGCPLSEDQQAILVGSLAVYVELQGTQDKSKSFTWNATTDSLREERKDGWRND